MEIPVLYEDKSVLVINKPAGTDSEKDLPAVFPNIYLVHRLDRETAGLMVLARTAEAAARLTQAVTEKRLTKEYLATVCGRVDPPEGELRDLLYHDRTKNKTYVVDRRRNGVKEAILTYTTVSSTDTESVVRIRLETGRTHQIRVQFAHKGNPLLGDRKYGGRAGDFSLTAVRLTFPHPVTGKEMCFAL